MNLAKLRQVGCVRAAILVALALLLAPAAHATTVSLNVAITITKPAASPSGATIADSTGSLVDSAGVVWTLSAGQAVRNGFVDIWTSGITLLLYYNGAIYQQADGWGWWEWVSGVWVGVSGDPRPAVATLSLVVVPAAPTVGCKVAAGTVVARAAATWSDGSAFTGTYAVTGDAEFTMSGANIVTATLNCPVAPAVGAAHLKVTATQ